jgi:hypothetical protein
VRREVLYKTKSVIWKDLQIPTVKEEIRLYSSQYSTRFSTHPNDLIVNLMELPDNNRRLGRHLPNDLPTRFLVYLIVVSVILIFQVEFVSLIAKSQKRPWTSSYRSVSEHSSTCHCVRFLHNLLNVLVQIADEMRLLKYDTVMLFHGNA